MARRKDQSLAEIKRIRRQLSARLMEAKRKGRLHQEMLALHAEAEKFLRQSVRGTRPSRRRKQA